MLQRKTIKGAPKGAYYINLIKKLEYSGMKINKAVIIGVGLIGGSIGKALIKRGMAKEVVGICRRQSSLTRAVKEKAVSKGYVNSYKDAVIGAEVIFIATPVGTVKDVLKNLARVINDKRILVTDAGSTKKEIADYAERFKDRFSFVGSHPLAGSEKIGVKYSDADLFKNSLCIVTKKKKYQSQIEIEKICGLWKRMGARIEVLSPEEHDKFLSFTSHLPHLAAYSLAGACSKKEAGYVSTGFKDTTRIASSDPLLWTDIFMTNRVNVLKAAKRFKGLMSKIENAIKNNKEKELKIILKRCKGIRDEIFKTR